MPASACRRSPRSTGYDAAAEGPSGNKASGVPFPRRTASLPGMRPGVWAVFAVSCTPALESSR